MPNDKKQTNTPPVLVQEDVLPPMPQQTEKKDDILNPTPPAPVVDSGSASPADDIKTATVMPAVVTSGPKKKFTKGKIIATILGLFLLVGGLGAGIFLVGQNQNIKEKAKSSDYANKCANVVCKSNEQCRGDGNCVWVGNEDDPQSDDRRLQYENIQGFNERCLYLTGPECGGGAWCSQELANDCSLWNQEQIITIAPTPTPTIAPTITPTATPTRTATPTATASSSSTSTATSTATSTSTSSSSPTATSTATSTSTSVATTTATPFPVPQTGASWSTVLATGFGILVILGSLLLAL